jgi:hypothetical protein
MSFKSMPAVLGSRCGFVLMMLALVAVLGSGKSARAQNIDIGDPTIYDSSFVGQAVRTPVISSLPTYSEEGSGRFIMLTNNAGGASGGTSGTSTGPVGALTRTEASLLIDFIQPPLIDGSLGGPEVEYTPLVIFTDAQLSATIPAHPDYSGATYLEYNVVMRLVIGGQQAFNYSVTQNLLTPPPNAPSYARTTLQTVGGQPVLPGDMTEGTYEILMQGRIDLSAPVNETRTYNFRHQWRGEFIVPEPTLLLSAASMAPMLLVRRRR